MQRVIAFVGFKSAGKNTAAQPLIARGYLPLSFADAMKDALAAIFCWERDLLEGISAESRAWRETIDPWWAARLNIPHFTPRWTLENFGTEIMRQHFHREIWVLNVERRILLHNDRSIVLIDGRFPNEIALAHRFGGQVFRIRRGPDPDWMADAQQANQGDRDMRALMLLRAHESQWAWIGSPLDREISNDGSIDELHHSVIAALPSRR